MIVIILQQSTTHQFIMNNTFGRRCSYCRQTGHYLSTCQDTSLIQFENSCIRIIRDPIFQQNRWHRFRVWLLEYSMRNPNTLKAYTAKKFKLGYRSHIGICIDTIENYFKGYYINYMSPGYSEWYNIRRQQIISPIISNDNLTVSLFMDVIDGIYNHLNHQGSTNLNEEKFNIQVSLSNTNSFVEELSCCSICLEENISRTNMILLDCKHEFCKSCVKKYFENERLTNPSCALCRQSITKLEVNDKFALDELKSVKSFVKSASNSVNE